MIAEIAALVHAKAEARDMAAYEALGAAPQPHLHRDQLTKQVLGPHPWCGAQHAELHLFEAAQA